MTDNTEAVALEPCPFCGGEAEAFHHELEGWEPTWHIECTADNCGNGTCHHVSEAEAIAAWNTRAKPDVVEADLKPDLSAQLDRLDSEPDDATLFAHFPVGHGQTDGTYVICCDCGATFQHEEKRAAKAEWAVHARAALAQTDPKPAEQGVDRTGLAGEPDRNQPHPLSKIWADAFHAWEAGSHWGACESLRAALSASPVHEGEATLRNRIAELEAKLEGVREALWKVARNEDAAYSRDLARQALRALKGEG